MIVLDTHVVSRLLKSQPHCLIAGIVWEQGATLATRDTKDFEGVGIALIDPWRTDSP